jgi:DNA repair protein RecN (Recombination protein N)
LGSLQKAAMLDPNVQLAIDQLAESSAYLEEAIVRLRRYRESLEPEPGRLEKINERLDLIHSLQRKYGDTIPEIIAFAGDIKQKIYSLEDTEAMESELTRRIGSLEANIIKLSGKLSDYRKSGGVKFSKLIVAELSDLAMSQTTFGVSVEPAPVISSTGADKVEFLISTNTGEPLRPLAKIASGGETSRLMLAIKSILARSSFVPTVIFDEIDIGIGGRTGRIIADKLAAMSSFAQVLCITHLPQIASRPAFAHFSIEKRTAAGRTTVSVVQLGPNERELEIARMLGGEQSQTVLQHAREMLSLI